MLLKIDSCCDYGPSTVADTKEISWRGFFEPAVASPPPRPLLGGKATFLNIFGCINRMDLIQSALDNTHLDACLDMLDYMYFR